MFIEVHMIQNFVPSNLNRDDTGSPKDCEFGGHRRARISSQCLKRSIRTNSVFAETTKVSKSKRTHYLSKLLQEALKESSKSPDDINMITTDLAHSFTTKPGKSIKQEANDPQKTAILAFISASEVQDIARKLLDRWDELTQDEKARKKIITEIVQEMVKAYEGRVAAPDIALFGRMLTSHPQLDLEAACQVAHALSTHRVSMEMDYFTAVDDVREANEEAGAGHINTMGFNSSCFYRYARIDWKQLLKNLNNDVELAKRSVEGFLRAALVAVPSGKQNSTAPLNPPSFLLGVVRTDGMGWNLANAFEKPVAATRNSSLVAESIVALDRYWGKLATVYGDDTLVKVATINLDGPELTHLNGNRTVASRKAWIDAILEPLSGATAGSQS